MKVLIEYSPNVIRLKGDKERDAETISYRLRGSNETHTLKIDEFIEKLHNEIKNKE